MVLQSVLLTTIRIVKIIDQEPVSAVQNSKHARYMRQEYKKRVKRLNCTLSTEQYKTLKKHAAKAGIPPTTFLRDTAFVYLKQAYLVPRDLEAQLATLTLLMRNMANNLNQIARHTNTLQKLTVFNALQARDTVSALEKMIKAYVRTPSQGIKHDD